MTPKKNRTTAGQAARDAQAAGADAPFNKLRRAAENTTAVPDAPAAPTLWEPAPRPPWSPTTIARLDDAEDRERASHADSSRYGVYVQQNARDFRPWHDEDPTPAEFAAAAWRVATGPIMSPGYAQIRPDLHGITLYRDAWEGDLMVKVTVPLRHYHLAGDRLLDVDDWETDPSHFDSDYRRQVPPDPEYARINAILTTAEIHHKARWWPLHVPAVAEGPRLVIEAHRALLVVVEHLNAEVAPLVQRLLDGTR